MAPVPLRVGVLAVQGAVSEHMEALQRAARATSQTIETVAVRDASDMDGVHGLIMPGGESTTISRLLRSSGVQDIVLERGGNDLALFGTCAGLILLCSCASHDVDDKDVQLLKFLDAEVDRNAFGGQRESFETQLDVGGIGTMPTVFIRAPAITEIGDGVEVLARFKDRIVAVRRGRILGTAFHPELTPDTRLHERFLGMVADATAASA